MSQRNGDRAKYNRERKKRMLRRLRSRELQKSWKSKAAEAATPPIVEDAPPVIASRLRQLPGEHQADLAALEIVVYQAPQSASSEPGPDRNKH